MGEWVPRDNYSNMGIRMGAIKLTMAGTYTDFLQCRITEYAESLITK